MILVMVVVMAAGCATGNSSAVSTPASQVSVLPAPQAPPISQPSSSSQPPAKPEDGPIITNGENAIERSVLRHITVSTEAPVVYFISDISPQSLMNAYKALGWSPTGKTAVKITTGEPPASNYLAPALIKDLVTHLNGTLVETNTVYGGSRAETAMHLQVAKDHGYTDIAPVEILDANGFMSLPVEGGTRLKENLVGKGFADYESCLVLSHFKGHAMAGFGGAIKNSAIGFAAPQGKSLIHSGGKSRTNAWGGPQDPFLEAMAEAGKSISDAFDDGKRVVYINVMNRLSVDCDCNGNPAEPDMHDISVLASTDALALDQACIDLVYAVPDSQDLVTRIESRNGLHTLAHAETIGLGSRSYRLVDLG